MLCQIIPYCCNKHYFTYLSLLFVCFRTEIFSRIWKHFWLYGCNFKLNFKRKKCMQKYIRKSEKDYIYILICLFAKGENVCNNLLPCMLQLLEKYWIIWELLRQKGKCPTKLIHILFKYFVVYFPTQCVIWVHVLVWMSRIGYHIIVTILGWYHVIMHNFGNIWGEMN